MAYRPSVYQTDPSFASSVDNLSSALFGDPRSEAAYAASLGNQRASAEEVMASQRTRGYLDQASDAVRSGNLSDALAFTVGAGDGPLVGQMPDLVRSRGALDPNTTDEQMGRLVVGSGDTLGENDFVSLQDRETGRQSNALNDRSLEGVKQQGLDRRNESGPLSRDEMMAQIYANEGPEAAVKAYPALYGEDGNSGTGQAVQYTLKDGTRTYGTFNNQTGYLDDQGRPADMQAIENVARIGNPTGTNDELGLTTATQTSLQGKQLGAESGLQFIERTREIANDPTNFGATGMIRGTVQDAIQQGDAFAEMLGTEGRETQKDIMANGYDIDPSHFDTDRAQLSVMRDLLAFKMASSIAQQEGRGLSDNDFRRFQKMFSGNDLFDNQKRFLARLDLAEDLLNDMTGGGQPAGQTDTGPNLSDALGGAQPTQSSQQAPQPGGPDVEIMDENLQNARAAIERGASADAVRQRLLENGYTADQIRGL